MNEKEARSQITAENFTIKKRHLKRETGFPMLPVCTMKMRW